jgi:ribonuclease I
MAVSKLSLFALIVVALGVATGVNTKASAIKSPLFAYLQAGLDGSKAHHQSSHANLNQPKYTEYDTLVVASEWAGSVCQIKKCNAGRPANPNFFNVHGLWPNVMNDFSKTPFDCKNTTVTINSLPMDVQTSLNYYWNPLYTPASGFLNHEWSKHGTCWNPAPTDFEKVPNDLKKVVANAQGSMSDEFNHQINYIKTTISVAQKYNVFAALASQGIVPNSKRVIQKDEFLRAMLNSLKVSKYEVICQRNPNGIQLLYEIRICLDKNYNPVDCKDLKYNCPQQWVYPEYA